MTNCAKGIPYANSLDKRFLTHRPEQFRSLLANKYYKLVYTVESDDVVIHAVTMSSYMLYGTVAAILMH